MKVFGAVGTPPEVLALFQQNGYCPLHDVSPPAEPLVAGGLQESCSTITSDVVVAADTVVGSDTVSDVAIPPITSVAETATTKKRGWLLVGDTLKLICGPTYKRR
jgi:hypothetical protein